MVGNEKYTIKIWKDWAYRVVPYPFTQDKTNVLYQEFCR